MSFHYEVNMIILRTLLFLCAAFGCCIASSENRKFRLPSEVFPLSYYLTLRPFIPEGFFNGVIYIEVNVTSPVDALYLHGSHLNISEVKIVGDVETVLVELQDEFELIKVYHENGEKINDGITVLYFEFSGTLLHADQMGLVKSKYHYKNGTEVLVVTEFQPTYARRAFPCFDDPSFKATFHFTIITPDSSWKALANTDEINHEQSKCGVFHRFKRTPPMSTNVISFAITKMDVIEKNYIHKNRNLRIRTFLGDAKEENDSFVLNFADKSVQYFEEFTGVDYPMSKIDLLEYDKKFIATEYWGLTTFNRGYLNPSSNLYDSRQISIQVAHELTHYWFGNLVTNKWWNDIWLQEGFAQYLSHKVVDSVFNTTLVEEYPLYYNRRVFKEDMQSKSVNPIVANCSTPKEIMLIFNDVRYIKAGSLIRLFDFITGVDGFKKIIRKYFEEFSFRCANTEDFVSIVEKIKPNQNLRDFLETWLLQNRYPIVNIEEDSTNKQYILRQRSASLFRDTDKMSPFGYKWTIPIIYTTDLKKEPTTVWFRKEMDFLTIPKGEESYIKLNYNFMGIYFTNYTEKMWLNLIENIHLLNKIEQGQLILEAEKLFEAEIINCDVMLRLISRFTYNSSQYIITPLSGLYVLRDKLKLDQGAISLLRQFYYKYVKKSNLVRRKEEDTENVIKKVRRSIHTECVCEDDIKTLDHKTLKSPKTVETMAEPTHPKYIKCAKWIHENLANI